MKLAAKASKGYLEKENAIRAKIKLFQSFDIKLKAIPQCSEIFYNVIFFQYNIC